MTIWWSCKELWNRLSTREINSWPWQIPWLENKCQCNLVLTGTHKLSKNPISRVQKFRVNKFAILWHGGWQSSDRMNLPFREVSQYADNILWCVRSSTSQCSEIRPQHTSGLQVGRTHSWTSTGVTRLSKLGLSREGRSMWPFSISFVCVLRALVYLMRDISSHVCAWALNATWRFILARRWRSLEVICIHWRIPRGLWQHSCYSFAVRIDTYDQGAVRRFIAGGRRYGRRWGSRAKSQKSSNATS